MNTPSLSAALLERVAVLVEEHYVMTAAAHQIAALMRSASTVPDPDADPAGFAAAATTLMRTRNGDRHLSVRYQPQGVQDQQDEATWHRWYAAQARANAGGISAVGRDQDTSTLAIAPYLSPVEYARPYIDAAMRLVAGARFLVIDVRACHGGTPDAVAHVCSYLLGPRPIHLQDVTSRNGASERFTTNPDQLTAPPQREIPIAVLTSSTTFSGGEDLAYTLQALDRATIVGEQTGGGAHPRQAFKLTTTLEAHVPVARSVNAITGGNWEGTGVLPDLSCPASDAPAQAATLSRHPRATTRRRP